MDDDATLSGRWLQALKAAPGSSSLASSSHPLRLFFGSDDSGRARLVLVLTDRPALPSLGELVRVERGQRASDSRWTLVLTLLDARLTGVFISLTEDLLDATAAEANEQEAMGGFLSALGDWRRLLTAKGPRELSLEALRGLCGELWVAINHLAPGHSPAAALAAWEGPLGHPQDFALPGVGLLEVKSIGSTSTKIKVSSAEQLDAPAGLLQLLVLRLPTAPEEIPQSFSLMTLLDQASVMLVDEPEVLTDLRFKLTVLGVDLSRDFYRTTHFLAESVTCYTVTDEFPAIRASGLSPAITNVRYELALTAIAAFLIDHKKL